MMKQLLCAFLLLALSAGVVAANEDDALLRAMQDEMARSIESLELEGMDRPYFIQYLVVDRRVHRIEGTFGAIVSSRGAHTRTLHVEVRTGSHELDNTGFLGGFSGFGGFGTVNQVTLSDSYDALRHELWFATDAAYKEALEQLSKKMAFRKNKVQAEVIPDFSREQPHRSVDAVARFELDADKWKKTVRQLSRLFREYPAVHESEVLFRVALDTRYFVNSEGTVVRQSKPLVTFYATASGQADDGARIKHYYPFHANAVDHLPSEEELEAAIRTVAEELTQLVATPVFENYHGPVLFSAAAAADLFAQTLAANLSGERPPESDMPQMSAMFSESELAGRMGRRVLPGFLSVSDDPTRNRHQDTDLIGGYAVDDQGVPARAVSLVKDGVLETLLMSRRPSKDLAHSTGHARSSGLVGKPEVTIGNLMVECAEPETFAQLKQQMLELCLDEGLEYGIIVRKMDDPVITGVDMSPQAMMMSMMSGAGGGAAISSVILAYRVYADDGREELVRGIGPNRVRLRALRDIVAAGDDYAVHNFLSGGGGVMGLAMLFAPSGQSLGMGKPSSVVAPSVLFEELELKAAEGNKTRPTVLAHPYYTK